MLCWYDESVLWCCCYGFYFTYNAVHVVCPSDFILPNSNLLVLSSADGTAPPVTLCYRSPTLSAMTTTIRITITITTDAIETHRNVILMTQQDMLYAVHPTLQPNK